MSFLYGPIWEAVKATGKAEVTASKDFAPTLIQGVRRTKSFENGLKRKTGKPRFPKLWTETIELSDKMVKIVFTLSYETRL